MSCFSNGSTQKWMHRKRYHFAEPTTISVRSIWGTRHPISVQVSRCSLKVHLRSHSTSTTVDCFHSNCFGSTQNGSNTRKIKYFNSISVFHICNKFGNGIEGVYRGWWVWNVEWISRATAGTRNWHLEPRKLEQHLEINFIGNYFANLAFLFSEDFFVYWLNQFICESVAQMEINFRSVFWILMKWIRGLVDTLPWEPEKWLSMVSGPLISLDMHCLSIQSFCTQVMKGRLWYLILWNWYTLTQAQGEHEFYWVFQKNQQREHCSVE